METTASQHSSGSLGAGSQAMCRLAQFLSGQFAQVLSQLGFSPFIENRCNLLALDPEPIRDVIQRCLARLFPVIVDLHRYGASLTVA
jgi:hypothetical protein